MNILKLQNTVCARELSSSFRVCQAGKHVNICNIHIVWQTPALWFTQMRRTSKRLYGFQESYLRRDGRYQNGWLTSVGQSCRLSAKVKEWYCWKMNGNWCIYMQCFRTHASGCVSSILSRQFYGGIAVMDKLQGRHELPSRWSMSFSFTSEFCNAAEPLLGNWFPGRKIMYYALWKDLCSISIIY